MALKIGTLTDTPLDKLPIAPPTDKRTCRLPDIPAPKEHCTDVSDAHQENSHLDSPPRTDPLSPYRPAPDPKMVKTSAPVDAEFHLRIPLGKLDSTEKP
jgi:hypothetical protein